ncbi:hypothetical protein B0H13DRAFT_2380286 [Mycena leptocephala]|nr:hypothetical protein B0H13DRAFT_2380286 [Mycena leptocephala]
MKTSRQAQDTIPGHVEVELVGVTTPAAKELNLEVSVASNGSCRSSATPETVARVAGLVKTDGGNAGLESADKFGTAKRRRISFCKERGSGLWFWLATFPAQPRKLCASLIAAGLRVDKEITADEVANLEYLDWVSFLLFITETQCLYNPAFQPTSHAQKDVIIPGGILVPERSRITVALHSLAVNLENWEDPLTFDPDRRGTEDVCKRHKHACIPFALGGCIIL